MRHTIIAMILFLAVIVMAPTDVMAATADTAGSTASSGETVTESADPQSAGILAASENVAAQPTGRGSIRITWKKVEGAEGYIVYRSVRENDGYKIIAKVSGNKSSYVNGFLKLKINRTYYYKVKAYVNSGSKKVRGYASSAARVTNKLNVKKQFRVKAYSYTGGGTTASGKSCKVGRIAVDPSVIKLGTWVYIPGYGIAQACDTGGNIKGKVVDLYQNSEAACGRWGVRYPTLYVLG